MATENQLKNLKPFGKGYEPNRANNKGKKYNTIKGVLNKVLNTSIIGTDLDGEVSRLTAKEQIAISIIKKAIEGDVRAFREIINRMEGKAPVAAFKPTNELD